nr:hypothetical protein GCM10025699_11830 [Microbacterium flavescens]
MHARAADEVEEDLLQRRTALVKRRERNSAGDRRQTDLGGLDAAHGETRPQHLERNSRSSQRLRQGRTIVGVDDGGLL